MEGEKKESFLPPLVVPDSAFFPFNAIGSPIAFQIVMGLLLRLNVVSGSLRP